MTVPDSYAQPLVSTAQIVHLHDPCIEIPFESARIEHAWSSR
jgi:hypothetical protein